MKKIILFYINLFCIAFISQAQITKGSVLLGGGISAFSSKSENNNVESKSHGFNFRPSLGFVIKDNQVLGFTVGYGRNQTKFENSPQTSTGNNYGAGVFYRKYIPLSKSFYLFGEAGFGYYSSKSENAAITTQSYKNTQEQTNTGLSLFPGIAYAVGKRFHLEASLNNLVTLYYSKNKSEQTFQGNVSKNESKGVSMDVNVSSTAPITLGFRFIIGK